MYFVRIEFKAEHAQHFTESRHQRVVETTAADIDEVMNLVQELEHVIQDCIVYKSNAEPGSKHVVNDGLYDARRRLSNREVKYYSRYYREIYSQNPTVQLKR